MFKIYRNLHQKQIKNNKMRKIQNKKTKIMKKLQKIIKMILNNKITKMKMITSKMQKTTIKVISINLKITVRMNVRMSKIMKKNIRMIHPKVKSKLTINQLKKISPMMMNHTNTSKKMEYSRKISLKKKEKEKPIHQLKNHSQQNQKDL